MKNKNGKKGIDPGTTLIMAGSGPLSRINIGHCVHRVARLLFLSVFGVNLSRVADIFFTMEGTGNTIGDIQSGTAMRPSMYNVTWINGMIY